MRRSSSATTDKVELSRHTRRPSTGLFVAGLVSIVAVTGTGCTTTPARRTSPDAAAHSSALPDQCETGLVPVSYPATTAVCVVQGARLRVTFAKPNETAIGVAGPWAVPPVGVNPPILSVVATSVDRVTLTALLTAEAPGTAKVEASFDQECTRTGATPCTVPPQATVTMTVKVVGTAF